MDKNNILSMKLDRSKKDQTITISYFVPELNRNRQEEITEQPHQDFLTALMDLSIFIADVFYASEDKKNLYSATGFKYTSDDKVILTGKMSTASGNVIGIATPSIDTSDDVYGFEDELAEVLSTMVVETHQLLTGKKVGVKQLTIDDAIEQNKEDDDPLLPDLKPDEESIMDDNIPENNEFILPE